MDVDNLTRRATLYTNEDGITELLIGFYLALTSAAWLLQQSHPGSELYIWLAQAAGIAAALVMLRGREKLKARYIYPHGGYVALDERRAGPFTLRVAVAGLLMLASLGFAYAMYSWGVGVGWKALAAGPAVIALAYIAGAVRYRVNYMLWVGAAMLAIALWFWRRPAHGIEDMLRPLFWQGVLLAASGAIRLWRFVRTHPRQTEQDA